MSESNLDRSVRNFGYKDYSDYLKSEQWQNFKQKYRESGRPQHCIHCNNPQYQLHHVTYKNICREKLDDVVPLCGDCHKKEHEQKQLEYLRKLERAERKKKKKGKRYQYGPEVKYILKWKNVKKEGPTELPSFVFPCKKCGIRNATNLYGGICRKCWDLEKKKK